ncbi:MAG TPA: hypothetical protein VLA19_22005 [Herpetosiphonaceae bacterium]|nr:hypothetical protein [Herpetosiphonaceae bacterium]
MSDAEHLPSDNAELLSWIRAERALLEQTLDRLTAEQMLRSAPDGWSVKDHLALSWLLRSSVRKNEALRSQDDIEAG